MHWEKSSREHGRGRKCILQNASLLKFYVCQQNGKEQQIIYTLSNTDTNKVQRCLQTQTHTLLLLLHLIKINILKWIAGVNLYINEWQITDIPTAWIQLPSG